MPASIALSTQKKKGATIPIPCLEYALGYEVRLVARDPLP